MASRVVILFTLILVIALSTVPLVVAGDRWNNARDYEAVTIKGANLTEFLNDSISNIFVYKYRSADDQWFQIPFQIDEQDTFKHVWVPNPNHLLDSSDVVIFMARDMGDKVTDSWIEDLDSRNHERYEITVADPNDLSQKAWVYIYFSSTLLDTVSKSYMKYDQADPDSANDTITAISYIESHNGKGIPNYWAIPITAGGNGVDLLDRQKARINAVVFNIINVNANEDFLSNLYIETVIGKVRIARRIWYSVLGLYTFDIPIYYFPYSINSMGASGTLNPAQVKASLIRQSFDLNQNASGMAFHNNYNTNITIDGINDKTVNKNLVFRPDVNWFMFTGNQGTILTLLGLTQLGDDSLYFYDNYNGGTADGTSDTGDMEAWGEVGIKITGKDLAGKFSIAYTTYFLPKNLPSSTGIEYVKNNQNPFIFSVDEQLVPVELSTFDASVSDDEITLRWITLSESNNYGFEVQRKSCSRHDWDKIGFVKGNGSTTSPNNYSFSDNHITENCYDYRLKQIDFDGSFEFSHIIKVNVQTPLSFVLDQNYPNPFNPETVIRYRIPELDQATVPVELKIYNLIGDEVKILVKKDQHPGYYSVVWDGKNDQGEIVAAGTYICRFRAGSFTKTNKMLLLR